MNIEFSRTSYLEKWFSNRLINLNHQLVLKYILIICIAVAILSTISNIYLRLSPNLIIFTGSSVAFYSILYILSLQKRLYYTVISLLIFSIFIALNFLWITNGGSKGPTLFILQAFVPMFIYFSELKKRLIILFLFFVNILILFAIEYFYPLFITDYLSDYDRFLDVFFISLVFFLIEIPLIILIQKQFISNSMRRINSEKVRNAFLDNMSHEFRTPMNAILGFSELLKDAETDQQTKNQYYEIIKNNGNNLIKLFNNLIYATKIETDILEVNIHQFSLNSLFSRIYNIYSNQISDEKKIIISYQLNKFNNFKVYTDENIIYQVLCIFINNAIKHTNKGSIVFGVKPIVQDNQRICFFISDTGIGIKKTILQDISDAIKRENNFKPGNSSILIAHYLIKKLHGEIDIKSKVGQGTTVTFCIPI